MYMCMHTWMASSMLLTHAFWCSAREWRSGRLACVGNTYELRLRSSAIADTPEAPFSVERILMARLCPKLWSASTINRLGRVL